MAVFIAERQQERLFYMKRFMHRILMAIRLDGAVYKEIAQDKKALPQAMAVILFTTLINIAVGSGLKINIAEIFGTLIIAFLGWYIWTFIIYLTGTKLFPGHETRVEFSGLLPVIGFSHAAGIFILIGLSPALKDAALFISAAWIFAAMVVAVKNVFGYKGILPALGICLIGVLIQAVALKFMLSLKGYKMEDLIKLNNQL
ncbi:MAG: hypothetical protein COV72_07895 [Candidatus Omnitrophica bacterium CG11_big_fil_rev_8_21_14_0_20_42_13]|uniref:Yip1 domain-containing protein n=1 Tax=Candidatus Ghiorseimicrobium undicola TaxID=1974746 RepID=A0A2H0LVT3_9BACT|nr:MAG: hypothetical protein COV72_07895 [Candidatus Omnitrophica bacterium CG11_big_fil_rev_8_21_14_0_20_42_13]